MAVIIKFECGENEFSLTLEPEVQYIIGRSRNCDLSLEDDQVSGKHCSIKLSPRGKTIIKDLGSTNGTYVNNVRIQSTYLQIDDSIQIGDYVAEIDEENLSTRERTTHARKNSIRTLREKQETFTLEEAPKRVRRTADNLASKYEYDDDDDDDSKTVVQKIAGLFKKGS